jgi:hypothetical protein
MTNNTQVQVIDATLRASLIELRQRWGVSPFSVLACAGYADEHWQIYHPEDLVKAMSNLQGAFPRYVISHTGVLEAHPDSASE